MSAELLTFLLIVLAFILVGVMGMLLAKPLLNYGLDSFVKRLLKDPYPENLGEMYNVFKKVGVQNVIESDLRGTTGLPLQRPFGTPKHYSAWDKLLFNPVYLTRKPVVESVKIDTQVIIGPQAKRPLYSSIPILIGGMAYGIGLSFNAKIALAKASAAVDGVTNTGVGPFLSEERQAAKNLIIQYHRGGWTKDEAELRQADAIEIQLGYGALGSVPVTIKAKDLSPEFRKFMNIGPDQDLTLEATLPRAKDAAGLKDLVNYLRKLTNGAPIGIKFGATQRLEAEMELFVKANPDFITLDGAEAGINYGPGILEDDTGLPALPALCRAVKFLKDKGIKDKVSLIVSGGLFTPGQFLKALALGADAVAIGTIVLMALAHTQISKVIPWEPPTELIYENGKSKNKLDIETGAQSVANFLKSCQEEMIMALRTMGWTSLKQLSVNDLCALSPEAAELTGATPCYLPAKTGAHGTGCS